jgi:hypothetical protein
MHVCRRVVILFRLLACAAGFCLVGAASSARAGDSAAAPGAVDRAIAQFREFLAGGPAAGADRGNATLSGTNEQVGDIGKAMEYARALRADGSWSDLDYQSPARSGWPPSVHCQRIFMMAVRLRQDDTSMADRAALEEALHRALGFWILRDPICTNWWYNTIGDPKELGQAAVLMGDRLNTTEFQYLTKKSLPRAKIGMTGQNRVWLAGNTLTLGLIERNEALIRQAADVIWGQIVISEVEGLQPDFSFQQHGPQQQFGNYGMAFAVEACRWGMILRGTPWAMPAEKLAIFRDYLLCGQNWVSYAGRMDISACGRQLMPGSPRDKTRTIATVMKCVARFDPAHAEDYLAYVRRNSITREFSASQSSLSDSSPADSSRPGASPGNSVTRDSAKSDSTPSDSSASQSSASHSSASQSSASHSSASQSTGNEPSVHGSSTRHSAKVANDLIGLRPFWRSDYVVDRRADFCATVKMHSVRTIGTEMVNSENQLGYYLSDGATYFYSRGDEYDDIFPVWDWNKLPGVTCPQSGKPPEPPSRTNLKTNVAFVGGVSDGTYGCAAMDLHRDGLSAQKAWFFAGDAVVCLGAGIDYAEEFPVTTTVNQCLLRGGVTISAGGRQSTWTGGDQTLSPADWVEHGGVRYTFAEPAAIHIDAATRSGNWRGVYNNPQTPKADVSKDVFTLFISHGKNPAAATYAYTIGPAGHAPAAKVLANSRTLQAVALDDGRVGIVFWEAGKFAVPNGAAAALEPAVDVAVDRPCAMVLDIADGSAWVADPTHLLRELSVTVGAVRKTVTLPTGGEAGKSTRVTIAAFLP